MELRPRTLTQIHSPIGAAQALRDRYQLPAPLLDLSQAAPSYPAPEPVIEAVQRCAAAPDGGRYVAQAGLPALRESLAAELSAAYGSTIDVDHIMITAGCNQAFTLVASTLCQWGDRMILPSPFYFNHDMWLRLDGTGVDHLVMGPDLVPDPERIEALITPSTRAVVIVTPGNPTGAIVAPDVIEAVAQVARRRGIALIIDETYRCFRGTDAPPHRLFADPDWDDVVISLHSFSKEFAIPGYRVGAVVGQPAMLAEALKLLDCVAICAPRIGQVAADAGLRHATDWRADKAAEIAAKQRRFEAVMASSPGGFELVSSGAYFGWVAHGRSEPTALVAESLLADHAILVIPGDAFTPTDDGYLRFSFANLNEAEIDELGRRLAQVPVPSPRAGVIAGCRLGPGQPLAEG